MGKCASKQQRQRNHSWCENRQLSQQILKLYSKSEWGSYDDISSISARSLILIIENEVN